MIIAIVLPFYNPEENWETTFLELSSKLSSSITFSIKWVLVNDGSTKNVNNEITFLKKEMKHNLQYISLEKNIGKGHAVRLGLQHCEATYYLYTDIDLPYTTESMKNVLDELMKNDYDVLFGEREIKYYDDIGKFRKYLSIVAKLVFNSIIKIKITDTQCGLKGFTNKGKSVVASTTIKRFLFDLELAKLLSKQEIIKYKSIKVATRDNIKLSYMGWNVLIKEIANLFKIMIS